MSLNASFDVLILGQGLAGSTLAWRLAERGMSVVMIDRGGVDEFGNPAASRVAAGLITPVTGKRLTVAEDFAALWASAEAFYRSIEKRRCEPLLEVAPAVRIFIDADERQTFLDRQAQGKLRDHARLAEGDELPSGVPTPHGAFVMPHAARLRVASYLDTTRQWLEAEGRYISADMKPDRDIEVSAQGVHVPKLDVTARRLVLCQGLTFQPPRWMNDVRFRPAKGEVLTIESPSYREERVLHCGLWLAPERRAGLIRVGSTTQWTQLDSMPTDAARTKLLSHLSVWGLKEVKVVEHLAAVRPATYDRKPTFGFSSEAPCVGWFNGLGAKGSLWAPYYAAKMADFVASSLR